MNPTPPQAAGSLNRFLNAIEAAGNKLPHITMLFIWALVITLVISLALSYVSFDYRHPSTGAVIAVTNMLAPANLLDLVVNSVKNFMGFPPLGITLVATLGIGIAEGSGFIHTLLRKLMSYIPRAALTPAVVIVSILCHVASDSVYVILMPLAALSTPMFPFYPLLIMYCQKYCKQAGVGTLSSMMIPYTLALLVALTFVLYAFWGIGIPIGFDSGYVYPPVK